MLFIEGEKVGQGRTERSIPYLISLDETLDVGTDAGTPVTDDYPARSNEFNGKINWVQIDLVLITKDQFGQVTPQELHHLTPEQARMFEPLNAEISALLPMSDIEEAGAAMENDSTAVLILFEHLWSKKFDEAVARANGVVLFNQVIPSDVVAENLDAMAAVPQ